MPPLSVAVGDCSLIDAQRNWLMPDMHIRRIRRSPRDPHDGLENATWRTLDQDVPPAYQNKSRRKWKVDATASAPEGTVPAIVPVSCQHSVSGANTSQVSGWQK